MATPASPTVSFKSGDPNTPTNQPTVPMAAVTQSMNSGSVNLPPGSASNFFPVQSAIFSEGNNSASPGSPAAAVVNTSLNPGSTGGIRSIHSNGIKNKALVSQPIAGQLTPNKNDHASVDVSSAFLSGKVSTEVAPEPDEGEEEMNTFRENPQNDGGSKAKQVFKLHRAQTLLVKPQLFGSLVGTTPFKVKMYERTSRQVGRRLPVDNCRLNTFDFKLPQPKLA